MKNVLGLVTLAALALAPALSTTPVMAAEVTCSTSPASSFKPQADLEAMLAANGLTVRQIKVENGCYEVYAVDKSGAKINTAYNAETLEQVMNAEAGEN